MPRRGEEVARVAADAGLRVSRRAKGGRPLPSIDLYVADTLGELGLFYRLCPLVFLGGSLVPHGGQNPIEPVRLESAILHGPHVHNFHEPYGALDAGDGARMVADEAALLAAVAALVAEPRALAAMSARGQAALLPLEGAVARTFAVLEPYVAQMKLSARERA